jgi:transcriptional regulator with XRE-family HTH domain
LNEQNYRKARTDAGVTVERAAVEMGVSVTTIYNWERGVTQPDANNVRAMAKLYGVRADYLLGME